MCKRHKPIELCYIISVKYIQSKIIIKTMNVQCCNKLLCHLLALKVFAPVFNLTNILPIACKQTKLL